MLVIHKLLREGHPNVSIGNLTSLAAISINRDNVEDITEKI